MSPRKPLEFSPLHARILRFLEWCQQMFSYPPSREEIRLECGISSKSMVNLRLRELATMGYIALDRRVARGIRLLRPAPSRRAPVSSRPRPGTAVLPVPVLGRIQAGKPLLLPPPDFNLYDYESRVEIPASELPAEPGQLFALEVQGDSMIDACICEGDRVVLRQSETAENGQMVAALLNGETTTLKYFYREGNRVRLQPANPRYEPIFIDDPESLQIQGQVVYVSRAL